MFHKTTRRACEMLREWEPSVPFLEQAPQTPCPGSNSSLWDPNPYYAAEKAIHSIDESSGAVRLTLMMITLSTAIMRGLLLGAVLAGSAISSEATPSPQSIDGVYELTER